LEKFESFFFVVWVAYSVWGFRRLQVASKKVKESQNKSKKVNKSQNKSKELKKLKKRQNYKSSNQAAR
jgi:uncharacterized membrane protein (DUF106 family)